MLNLPENQAHACRCNKPSTAGMGKPHPQPAPRCSGPHQALMGLLQPSGQVSKGTRALCSPQQSHSNLPVYAPALLPHFYFGEKTNQKGFSSSCCLPAVLNPCHFLQLKGKLIH